MGWFTEYYNGCGLTIRIRKKIVEKRNLQKVEIFETESFGKMLVLDGKIQLTEFDEAFYHEMLVHVPMFIHDNPERVLIIGGGDGGAAREVLKHDPEKVVIAEVDRDVVELCRKYIKIDDGAFDDGRVELKITDGKEFVKKCEKFDVIIVDSTDPVSVSMSLFDEEFFSLASEKCDVFSCQSQSPLVQKEYFYSLLKNSSAFKNRRIYLSYVPTYPLSLWSFLLAGSKLDIEFDELKARFRDREIKTKYYNPEIHFASFSLPEWLKEELKDVLK